MLTLNQFVDTVDRLEEARLLMASLEFKIYTILRRNSMTARQIARAAKTTFEGMEALLNALVALKALRFREGRYSSAPQLYKYFCESSPHYLKGTTHLKKENQDEWALLVQVIRKGRDFKAFKGPDNPAFRHCFTHAMHERSGPFASKVASLIARKPVGKLLDLGAGPGTYSAAVLRKDKEATATLVDRPAALKVARQLHGQDTLWKRIQCIKGDLFTADYGNGHNTVLYSNILHIYNPSQNRTIFRKVKRALAPGGRLVLVDFFHTRDATQPYEAALFGVTMLMYTATGKTYSYDETEKLLSSAGFGDFKRFSLNAGAGLLVAVRK